MLETRRFPSFPVLPVRLGQFRHPKRLHGPVTHHALLYCNLKERSQRESMTHTTPEYIDMT